VTIPHKAQIHDLVDACTISAAAIGAVNTLYARDGRVIGENTDAAGFMKDVQAAFPGLLNREGTRRALILGAGGAARAVAYSLINCGWQVGIAARSLDQAISIADDFEIYLRSGQIEPLQLEAGAMTDYLHYHPIHLLVNATPVGMHPHIDESPWPDGVPFPDGACAYDLVYNPPWTQFTKKAKEAGLQAATGLGMLIEQAALSFELWTGRNAPRAAIRQGFVDWRSG
jgi:shikimate dehydrogenase